MTLFTCPICAAPLQRQPARYCCPNGHSYDIAREGYVHLLPANRKHAKEPGDDREMTAARTRFLEGGWYDHLREALCALAAEHLREGGVLVDAGCGEGYYTAAIAETLSARGLAPRIAGVDLSKFALKKAARRVKAAEFAVASVYHLPMGDAAADVLLDCFAPLAIEEYRRVLRPGGAFLYVVPGPDHLMEMKEVLYDAPYQNPEETEVYDGFACEGELPVSKVLRLPSGGAIMDLLHMTPYAWKTPKEGIERLARLEELKVTASFRVLVFRKRS